MKANQAGRGRGPVGGISETIGRVLEERRVAAAAGLPAPVPLGEVVQDVFATLATLNTAALCLALSDDGQHATPEQIAARDALRHAVALVEEVS